MTARAAWAVTVAGLALVAVALCTACDPSARAADAAPEPAADAAPSPSCEEGATRCAADALERCSAGAWTTAEVCTGGTFCEAARGCVACPAGAATACAGSAAVHACNPDGTLGAAVDSCEAGETCAAGACVDACAHAAEEKSYAGCEYLAADLDNVIEFYGWPDEDGDCFSDATPVTTPLCTDGQSAAGVCGPGGDCAGAAITTCQTVRFCAGDAQHAPFAIVVANPDADRPLAVRLADAGGHHVDVTLAAGETRALLPQALGFVDRSLDHSGVVLGAAYRVTAERPIVAYQFNPLDDVKVFSNDASLLLPTHTWGHEHVVVTRATAVRRPERDDWDGTITVVAAGTPGETTSVTVTPAAAVRAGPGVPALAAGESHTFTLAPLAVLNLEGASGDLTGTRIVSDKPVLVFAGHEATGIGGGCCADHLEDVMLPAHAWGQRYAVARSKRRPSGAPDLLRIVALHEGTQVSFDPPVATCAVLAPGLGCDVLVDQDVVVNASGPVMVAHFLTSDGGGGPNSGDPALALAVPVEQFRRDYTLLVPDTYFNSYLSLVVPEGGVAKLDGVVVGGLSAIGASGFRAARVPLAGGTHRVECSRGCGVEVYGWGEAVSYLYPGGLDVKAIVD